MLATKRASPSLIPRGPFDKRELRLVPVASTHIPCEAHTERERQRVRERTVRLVQGKEEWLRFATTRK